ncbi:single-stranded DNA-binding protein [Bifidobacterium eulemuris]|uniref:Single-stranded DNA-binding protein n=1 Tax=Bifidobacterium eulemuris TaxID=1765219 RepID=A0A261GCH2_9BIFI|nr:single-stranded DNA-binding protein [Bifidobacterium eulemuris]OZG68666.1 single-strand binding protein [Bifidobacterium eulemuris]QOL32780.1 single-stranded DNA-binding protein [Bifidobacterium eulemuris]
MAQRQGSITISGNLGADPVMFGKDPNQQACSFRVGFAPSYYSQSSGEWKNRDTTWVAVRAFRKLGLNAFQSLRKGNPVVVTGTLRTERWTKDGVDHITPVVEATNIGHDLNFGTTIFRRVVNPQNGQDGQNVAQTNQVNGMASYPPVGADPFAQPAVPKAPVGMVDLGVDQSEPPDVLTGSQSEAETQPEAEMQSAVQYTDGFAPSPEHDEGEAEF